MKTTDAILWAMCAVFVGCEKETTIRPPEPTVPSYVQELVESQYVAEYGDWTVGLGFDIDAAGLVAVLTRDEDGLLVEFDCRPEFFPFSYSVPSYLVLTPRQQWAWEPYAPQSGYSYWPLLLECYLYTANGTQWPPSAFDNFNQTNPIESFIFFRIN